MQPQLKTECKVPEGNVFEPRFGWEMVQPESSLLLSLCADGPRSFTPEQLRTRQYNDHAALWKVSMHAMDVLPLPLCTCILPAPGLRAMHHGIG